MGGPCELYVTGDQLRADRDVCAENPTDPSILDYVAKTATDVVWALTGRQFHGICTATVRPRRNGVCRSWPIPFGAYRECEVSDAIPLVAPVVRDEEHPLTVKIDGEEVTDWFILDHHLLVRAGGYWPTNAKLHLADTADGTFSITYSFGREVPGIVLDAAHELAVEYARSVTLDPRAKLPAGTTSVSRSGQSVSLRTEAENVRKNGSDLAKVTQAIGTFNPTGARQPAEVWSPDDDWVLHTVS